MDSPMKRSAQDLFDLRGRCALVTGAAGYLGSAMTEALCEAGSRVIAIGRNAEKLAALEKAMKQRRFRVTTMVADITDPASVREVADAVRATCRTLNILVNNAYAGTTGTLETAQPRDFEEAYRIAVVAPFALMKELGPLLKQGAKKTRCCSSVINISSIYGLVSPDLSVYQGKGHENPPYYGAAKAGLLQLTRYAACEWGKSGVRVNAIAPGPFPPPTVRRKYLSLYKNLCKKTPLARIGSPYELKGAPPFSRLRGLILCHRRGHSGRRRMDRMVNSSLNAVTVRCVR